MVPPRQQPVAALFPLCCWARLGGLEQQPLEVFAGEREGSGGEGKMDAFQIQLPGQKKAVDDDIMQCTIRVEIGDYCVQVGAEI